MKYFNSELVSEIYKLWQGILGMVKIILPSNVECLSEIECYRYKNMFLRLDTFYDNGELMYCIEAAESKVFAQNNIFDDAWLYPESMGTDKIIAAMKNDLQAA